MASKDSVGSVNNVNANSVVSYKSLRSYTFNYGPNFEYLMERAKMYADMAYFEETQGMMKDAFSMYEKSFQLYFQCCNIVHERDCETLNRIVDESEWINIRIKELAEQGFGETSTPTVVQVNRQRRDGCNGERLEIEFTEGEGQIRAHFKELLDSCTTTTFAKVLGYVELKRAIMQTIVIPRQIGLQNRNIPSNILFFGPPGTGKTMLSLCLGHELGLKVMKIKSSDILDKYIGQGPAKLKLAFEVAINNAPCVMFFDEMETMFPDRSSNLNRSGASIVTEFLAQFNLLEDFNARNPEREVLLVAASNFPNLIDSACWRRFGNYYYVPMLTKEERKEFISATLGTNVCRPLQDVHWEVILLQTDNFSNSDLKALCEDVELVPLRKCLDSHYFKNVYGISATTGTMVFGWIPCLRNDPQAEFIGVHDVEPGTLVLPPITPRDIVLCCYARSPSLDVTDENGVVKTCEDFAKRFANHTNCEFSLEKDDDWDPKEYLSNEKDGRVIRDQTWEDDWPISYLELFLSCICCMCK